MMGAGSLIYDYLKNTFLHIVDHKAYRGTVDCKMRLCVVVRRGKNILKY